MNILHKLMRCTLHNNVGRKKLKPYKKRSLPSQQHLHAKEGTILAEKIKPVWDLTGLTWKLESNATLPIFSVNHSPALGR